MGRLDYRGNSAVAGLERPWSQQRNREVVETNQGLTTTEYQVWSFDTRIFLPFSMQAVGLPTESSASPVLASLLWPGAYTVSSIYQGGKLLPTDCEDPLCITVFAVRR